MLSKITFDGCYDCIKANIQFGNYNFKTQCHYNKKHSGQFRAIKLSLTL